MVFICLLVAILVSLLLLLQVSSIFCKAAKPEEDFDISYWVP